MQMRSSKNPWLTVETRQFLDELAKQNPPPLYTLTPEQARKVLSDTQAMKVEKLPADLEDMKLSVGPTGEVDIRVIRPAGNNDRLPVVFYFHGGGWVMGDKETHDRLVRELAVGAGVAVVFVNYTPSPEAQFPVPIEQDYAAMEYVVKNADRFNVDISRLAVAGDSVGGNMAAVMALLAKQHGAIKIKFQLLIYPVTDADFDNPTYQAYGDGPWLTKKAMEWFWDQYLPDKSRRKDIIACPLQATTEQLKGLPEAFIITDQNDVLCFEGEAYAHKLEEAGVKVTAVRYNGTFHDFMMLNPLADSSPTRAAVSQAVCALKKALK